MDIDKQKAIASSRSVDNLRLLMMSCIEGATETSQLLYDQLIAGEMTKLGVQPRDFFQTIISILSKIRDSFPLNVGESCWERTVATQTAIPDPRNNSSLSIPDQRNNFLTVSDPRNNSTLSILDPRFNSSLLISDPRKNSTLSIPDPRFNSLSIPDPRNNSTLSIPNPRINSSLSIPDPRINSSLPPLMETNQLSGGSRKRSATLKEAKQENFHRSSSNQKKSRKSKENFSKQMDIEKSVNESHLEESGNDGNVENRLLGEIQNRSSNTSNASDQPRTSYRLALKRLSRESNGDNEEESNVDETIADNPNFTMRRIRPIQALLNKVKTERFTPKINKLKRPRGRPLKGQKQNKNQGAKTKNGQGAKNNGSKNGQSGQGESSGQGQGTSGQGNLLQAQGVLTPHDVKPFITLQKQVKEEQPSFC